LFEQFVKGIFWWGCNSLLWSRSHCSQFTSIQFLLPCLDYFPMPDSSNESTPVTSPRWPDTLGNCRPWANSDSTQCNLLNGRFIDPVETWTHAWHLMKCPEKYYRCWLDQWSPQTVELFENRLQIIFQDLQTNGNKNGDFRSQTFANGNDWCRIEQLEHESDRIGPIRKQNYELLGRQTSAQLPKWQSRRILAVRGQDITADAKTADKNVMHGQNLKIMLSIRPSNLRYREF
jgi:hypothetical protein